MIGGIPNIFSNARIVYNSGDNIYSYLEVYYNEANSGHNNIQISGTNLFNTTFYNSATPGEIPSGWQSYEVNFWASTLDLSPTQLINVNNENNFDRQSKEVLDTTKE